jgi:hypothetical protein
VDPYQRVISACNEALEGVRATIPPDLYSDVHDYINKFNECGLAIETLVDQIHEYDIKITRSQRDSIVRAFLVMELGSSSRINLLYIQCSEE